jgi:hypothetical protein
MYSLPSASTSIAPWPANPHAAGSPDGDIVPRIDQRHHVAREEILQSGVVVSAQNEARCLSFSGFRTTEIAFTTSPSISKVLVCTNPFGPLTISPGKPLIVSKRTDVSPVHPLRTTPATNAATRRHPR